MFNVFMLQWKRLFKRPALVIMFLVLTVIFVYFMGGAQMNSTVTVPVYSEELSSEEMETWLEHLNQEESITFEAEDYETVEEDIRMNELSFAVELEEDNYRFLVGREDEYLPAVDQHIQQIFREQVRLEDVRENFPNETIEVEEFLAMDVSAYTDLSGQYNAFQLQILVGMTLYFVVYTILFLQMNLIEEKTLGTWDRLVTSPVTKIQIYLGHLFHYFIVGIIQIALSFFILTNLMNIDLGSNYLPMIVLFLVFLYTIISLGILLVGLVPKPQSLQVIIPIVATAMAMLGGAFWPLDVVSNDLILLLGEFMPIKHALYGIMDALQYNSSLGDLIQPIGILLLMGVLFMGIGINLMERPTKR
jgi:ABC-2 type transport system permease protein